MPNSNDAQRMSEHVVYEVGGILYEGFWSKVADNAPLVLLVHAWGGLTEYEKTRASMLSDLGYNVFALDLFGQGVRPTEIAEKRQHMQALYRNRDKLRLLMNAGKNTASELGGDTENMVVMGYCFGGAAVLEMARAGVDARGVVSFHGALATPEEQDYAATTAPILIFHGCEDTIVPMSDVEQLTQQLESHHVPHEIITFGGAPHAFTVFDTENYHKEADEQSWHRFIDFLAERTQ
ncbi:MAG: dienelactone hydrolase family protein [Vibrio sp.]